MFKFLGLLLLLAIFGFLVIGVLLGRAIRFFAPTDRNKTSRSQTTNNSSQDTTDSTPKKFSKNEGEYIDYEEVKDE